MCTRSSEDMLIIYVKKYTSSSVHDLSNIRLSQKGTGSRVQGPAMGNDQRDGEQGFDPSADDRNFSPGVCLITLFTLVTSQQTPHPKRLSCRSNHPNKCCKKNSIPAKPELMSLPYLRGDWQALTLRVWKWFNNVLYSQTYGQRAFQEVGFHLGVKLVCFVWASGLFLWLTKHYMTTSVLCRNR